MGVKNCPETPRQRMISLMYLVLTAMLALNVDKSVVDAFALVDQGFMKTIENFNNKNRSVYNNFDKAAQENPQKVGELNRTVQKIKEQTDSLYNYITHFKMMIVKKADGPEGRVDSIVSKEDLNYAEEIMMTQKNGTLLKKAIENYRTFLISHIDSSQTSLITSISKSLDTSNPPRVEGSSPTWESSKFQGYPLIAVVTLMSKMQSDIRNSESDVINYYYTKIDASSFKFNNLKAQVVPKSNFILQGDTYEAKVFISAIDTTAIPEILVNGSKLPIIHGENAGLYRVPANSEGNFVWKGVINFKNSNGQVVQYPFQQEYQVSKPSATVSPTKMNILYVGLANPVSVSVPGFSSRDIQVTIKNGRIEQTANGYLVHPDKAGVNAVISVNAMVDKVSKFMGSMEFRVKNVPDPVATISGIKGGLITKAELMNEDGIFADIPGFDFEMKFQVLSFVVNVGGSGGFEERKATKGNLFTSENKAIFKNLNRGQRIYFDDIVVKGDDGVTRTLPAISLKIK